MQEPKLCKDCKYYVENDYPLTCYSRCSHPDSAYHVSLITGGKSFQSPTNMRDAEVGLCGKEAKLFEPNPVSFWKKVFK
jgi:hypothetical protein